VASVHIGAFTVDLAKSGNGIAVLPGGVKSDIFVSTKFLTTALLSGSYVLPSPNWLHGNASTCSSSSFILLQQYGWQLIT
jgi:hypothetical protein